MAATEFNKNLFVSIKDDKKFAGPYPMEAGFSTHRMYRVLGVFNYDSTSVAHFMLSNDFGEIWFIDNRHLKAEGLFELENALSMQMVRVYGSD